MQPSADEVLTAVRASHDRLVAALAPLSDEQVAGPSYADEWSIAQVASHLGSGAEIFGLFVDAGRRQVPAPGAEQFGPIWDTWNAKPAPEQARDAVRADAAFLDRVDALSPDEREQWRLDMFGSEHTLSALLRLRLGEHALHTWDIVVALDPSATVAEDATAIVVDAMPGLVARTGRPAAEPYEVLVTTSAPARSFLLEVGAEGARLSVADATTAGASPARLRAPAEAFVRLVYGRLDPDHTPAAVETHGVELDTLRAAFPGA
jgi:uncharacterized protein (TIGR03083 family)